MEDEYSRWNNLSCKACAVAVAGVCFAHAVGLSGEPTQPILFYKSDEGHPKPERTPQPQQQSKVTAPTSSSVMPSIEPGMFAISGNPPKDFTLTWINHEGEKIVFDAAVPLEITSKSA